MTNQERPDRHPDPVARVAIATGRLVRRALTKKGAGPEAPQPTNVGEPAIDAPASAHDGHTVALSAIERPAPAAPDPNALLNVPDTSSSHTPEEVPPASSPYSRPIPPHKFQKPAGPETSEAEKTRREAWMRVDPDGQTIAQHLERAKIALAYLQDNRVRSRAVDTALDSFKHDPTNPDSAANTVMAATNSQARLEDLTKKLMDHNPYNIGTRSAIEVPGSPLTGGEAKSATIRRIDQYGRLVTSLPHPDRPNEFVTTTFDGVMEKIEADKAAASPVEQPNPLPPQATPSPSQEPSAPNPRNLTDGGAWGN